MAWGQYIEIYLARKETPTRMGETLIAFTAGGYKNYGVERGWTPEEVRIFAKKLNQFNEKVQEIIKETDGENLCVRTNM